MPRHRPPARPLCSALAATASLVLVGALVASPARAAVVPRANRQTHPSRANPAWVPGRVIVGYRANAQETSAAQTALIRMGLRRREPAPQPRSEVLSLPVGESVPRATRALRRLPGIAYAEPDYIAEEADAWVPNDPGRSGHAEGWEQMQWNFLPGMGIDAPDAWGNLIADGRAGGSGVTIAVLDTGVAYRNWRQYRMSPDFRGTKFVQPYDFVSRNPYPLDRNGHGTFVAGVIGEATNNGIGLAGLAYGASIMPVRVLDAEGDGDELTIARGIRYAVAHGANIINLSLEFLPTQVKSGQEIPQIVSAIDYARRRNVIVVGAAGNDTDDQVAYPARVTGVISVGATTRDGCLATYSNGGAGLALVAPGGGSDAIRLSDPACHPGRTLPPIYQLTLTDVPHWARFGYPNYYIGTSMSAPEVSATAALVIASGVLGPHPTPAQVLARLQQTATPLPLGATAPNPVYGYGLLNAGAATAPLTGGTAAVDPLSAAPIP